MLKLLWHFCSVWLLSYANNSVSHIVWKPIEMSHLNFTCLVTLYDCKLQVFKNSPKSTNFGIFNELLSIHNGNVARFARNVKWDFFLWFSSSVLEILKKEWNSFDKWNILQILQKFTRTIFFVKKKTLSS